MNIYKSIKAGKTPDYFSHMVTIGSVVHSCISLREQGFNRTPSHFFIPSFIMFFGAPLYANLVYKQMMVDHTLLGSYFLGVAISMVVGSSPLRKRVSAVFPAIGRMCMLYGMCRGPESLTNIAMWMLMNEFMGLVLRRVLLGEKGGSLANHDFGDLLGNILIVYFCRQLRLSPAFIVLSVAVLTLIKYVRMEKLRSILASPQSLLASRGVQKARRQAAVQTPAPKTPAPKTPAPKTPAPKTGTTRQKSANGAGRTPKKTQ